MRSTVSNVTPRNPGFSWKSFITRTRKNIFDWKKIADANIKTTHVGIIWQGFYNIHHNASISNYEHVWNKRKTGKSQQREKHSQQGNKSYKEESNGNFRNKKSTITEI